MATVEAIIESGAKPICTEIDETLNMCPLDLMKKLQKNKSCDLGSYVGLAR